jgi:hypothetical protein
LSIGQGRCNAGPVIENGANLVRQLRQREWLLQEVGFDVNDFVVKNGLAGIAGDEEQSSFGAKRIQFFRQLPSTHVGHDDIGDGQMDRRSMILRKASKPSLACRTV